MYAARGAKRLLYIYVEKRNTYQMVPGTWYLVTYRTINTVPMKWNTEYSRSQKIQEHCTSNDCCTRYCCCTLFIGDKSSALCVEVNAFCKPSTDLFMPIRTCYSSRIIAGCSLPLHDRHPEPASTLRRLHPQAAMRHLLSPE